MSQNLIYVLENDQSLFSNSIRMFFAHINRFLYRWIGNFLDIMYRLAENIEFNEYGEMIVDRLYNILIIFMVFRLTISLLTYIVDPDTFTDKGKGAASLIKRVLISVIVLASINPIFDIIGNLQHEILNNGIIENLLMGSKNDSVYYTEEGKRVYLTEISSICDDIGAQKGENLKVATTSPGKHLALLTLKPFIQPTPASDGDYDTYVERIEALYELGYCGVDITNYKYIEYDDETLELSFGPFNNTSDYLMWPVYNGMTGTWSPEKNVYYIDFNYIFALITGIIVCLIMISFCFDVVIRSLTLVLLKVIAPISAISYISPKGKSSEMLPIWGKKILSTWASLFVRIASVSLAMSVISAMCESGGLTKDSSGLLESLIIILGALMFAKALPKLLEELIPGIKFGGMELNPFKRIRKDALGGDMIMNAAGRATGLASGIAGGARAGWKAGNEIGMKRGKRFLAAAAGGATGGYAGFQNKKWSYGKGLDDAYRGITGNSFKRLSPTAMFLNKFGGGEASVKEAKDYLNKAYNQLNSLRTDLNVSENRTAALAQNLLSNGYDITNKSGDELKAEINAKISDLNASVEKMEADVSTLEAEMNAAQNSYNSAQATVNGKKAAFEAAQSSYNQSQEAIERIKTEIFQKQTELTAAGDGLRANSIKTELDALSRNLQSESSKLATAKGDIAKTKEEFEIAQKGLDSFKKTLDEKVKAYNDKVTEISNTRAQIQSKTEDISSVDTYTKNRTNEDKIRSEISRVEKDIDVVKKERTQREMAFRIDAAPQQDYETSTKNINDRDNKK